MGNIHTCGPNECVVISGKILITANKLTILFMFIKLYSCDLIDIVLDSFLSISCVGSQNINDSYAVKIVNVQSQYISF